MHRCSRWLIALACTALGLIGSRAAHADWVDEWKAPEPAQPRPKKPEPPDLPEWDRVRFDDRPFSVQLRLGAATSVGLAGIVGEYDVADWINVGAGLGTNYMGVIAGAHIRLRPAVYRTRGGGAAHAFVLETAVSRGRYSGSIDGVLSLMCEGPWDDPRDGCYNPPVTPEWVWWTQFDFGWEFRGRSGFLFRASTGAAFLVEHPEWKCTLHGTPAPCGHSKPAAVLPSTLTCALGYAF